MTLDSVNSQVDTRRVWGSLVGWHRCGLHANQQSSASIARVTVASGAAQRKLKSIGEAGSPCVFVGRGRGVRRAGVATGRGRLLDDEGARGEGGLILIVTLVLGAERLPRRGRPRFVGFQFTVRLQSQSEVIDRLPRRRRRGPVAPGRLNPRPGRLVGRELKKNLFWPPVRVPLISLDQ